MKDNRILLRFNLFIFSIIKKVFWLPISNSLGLFSNFLSRMFKVAKADISINDEKTEIDIRK